MKEKEQPVEIEGVIMQSLPNATFRVKVNGIDKEIVAYVAGKLRQHLIKIVPGDKVKLEMSPYDLTKARIVYREK